MKQAHLYSSEDCHREREKAKTNISPKNTNEDKAIFEEREKTFLESLVFPQESLNISIRVKAALELSSKWVCSSSPKDLSFMNLY